MNMEQGIMNKQQATRNIELTTHHSLQNARFPAGNVIKLRKFHAKTHKEIRRKCLLCNFASFCLCVKILNDVLT